MADATTHKVEDPVAYLIQCEARRVSRYSGFVGGWYKRKQFTPNPDWVPGSSYEVRNRTVTPLYSRPCDSKT